MPCKPRSTLPSSYPHLLGEYNASGQPVREYIWLGDTPVAIAMADPANPLGPPKLYSVHTDHLNTPQVVMDRSNAAMRWRWMTEPFGTTQPEESTNGTAAFTQPLRFPGQYSDGETGMAYNVMRSYIPGVGRYSQSDPIGLAGGINTYGYVGGNPVSGIDPLGLKNPSPATPGGNSYNRRQWRRHGPGSFERPTGEGNRSAWEAGGQMFAPDPDEGDYKLRCLRWECSENSCTPGKSPTDFLPAAYQQDDAPTGCKCVQTNLGPVFNPPGLSPEDLLDFTGKYRRSDGQLGRMLRSILNGR